MSDKLNIKGWEVGIATDLYEAFISEDGTPYTAECYRVVLTRSDGFRMSHDHIWYGCEVETNPEDGICHAKDVRYEAKKNAETLALRVEEKGEIDQNHWNITDPVYGSEYYCKYYGF